MEDKKFVKYDIEYIKEEENFNNLDFKLEYDLKVKNYINSFDLKIDNINEIINNNNKIVLKFNLNKDTNDFNPLQNIFLFPENDEKSVDIIKNKLEIKNNFLFKLIKKDRFKLQSIKYVNINEYLKRFIDLNQKINLKELNKLEKFISKEIFSFLQNELLNNDNQIWINILPNKTNLVDIINLYTMIKPRIYTNCNLNKTEFIISIKINEDNKILGTSSNYLNYLYNNNKENLNLKCYFNPSIFILPKNNYPILLIGNGSGIAPLKVIWENNNSLKNKIDLFYGIQNKEKDFLFKEDILNSLEKNLINKLIITESRINEKCYIQNKFKDCIKNYIESIKNFEIYIYICGSFKMSEEIIEIINNEINDKNLIKELLKNKVIMRETWG